MNSGFLVGFSIMVELSFGICTELYELPPYQKEAYEKWNDYLKITLPTIPKEFMKEWQSIWQDDFKPQVVIMHLADLADAIFETEYDIAKSKIQALDFQAAFNKIIKYANDYSLQPALELPLNEQFAKLATQVRQYDHKLVGLTLEDDSTFIKNNYKQYYNLIKVLKNKPLYDKFWKLLDYFYYNILTPFREERSSTIKAYYNKTIQDLGGKESDIPPNLDELPLTISKDIAEKFAKLNKKIFFWVDPYNCHGITSLRHNFLMIGCNNHSFYLNDIDQGVVELTNGLKALSDPTRIKILRLIRHFSMDNTQMAEYLNITRPTVSNHTKILREANLIESKLEGRSTRHYINVENINKLLANLSVFLDI